MPVEFSIALAVEHGFLTKQILLPLKNETYIIALNNVSFRIRGHILYGVANIQQCA